MGRSHRFSESGKILLKRKLTRFLKQKRCQHSVTPNPWSMRGRTRPRPERDGSTISASGGQGRGVRRWFSSGGRSFCRSPFWYHFLESVTVANTSDKIPEASEIPGIAGQQTQRKPSTAQLCALFSRGSGRKPRMAHNERRGALCEIQNRPGIVRGYWGTPESRKTQPARQSSRIKGESDNGPEFKSGPLEHHKRRTRRQADGLHLVVLGRSGRRLLLSPLE